MWQARLPDRGGTPSVRAGRGSSPLFIEPDCIDRQAGFFHNMPMCREGPMTPKNTAWTQLQSQS